MGKDVAKYTVPASFRHESPVNCYRTSGSPSLHIRARIRIESMNHLRSLLLVIVALVLGTAVAAAQDSTRYYRLYLRDKGTSVQTIRPGDSLYAVAAAGLTPRALARRAKVLPADSLVTMLDLPVLGEYLARIQETGVVVLQKSRWLNSVMVLADSAAYERVRVLPFLDSAVVMRARERAAEPFGKRTVVTNGTTSPPLSTCITDHYGAAATQNRLIGIDEAHRMGIAGEGVLIGVLDAGFDPRNHEALRGLNVIGEYDFVNNDSSAADAEGEDAEGHGTTVMSMIGGMRDGTLVGGAIHASFILAKTEDVRSERHVEEDDWVAGIEWIEAMGADVTNTSLSYTTFDDPEAPHLYSELNGHTAFASRGLNQAVRFGMICVVAAGNDGQKSYRYIGVPAEADSSIAAAAVDSTGRIAPFSSRWFGDSPRLKPDVAAMGVANWGANHSGASAYLTGQGTSYAAPMTTSAIALLLSARPSLRPWEVRALLYATADHADRPDTAYGHGVISIERALAAMSRTMPVVGYPRAVLIGPSLAIAAGVRLTRPGQTVPGSPPTEYLAVTVRKVGSAASTTVAIPQPLYGTARWYFPAGIEGEALTESDRVEITFIDRADGAVIRRDTIGLGGQDFAWNAGRTVESIYADHSVLCASIAAPGNDIDATATPNPFVTSTVIGYQTNTTAHVTLVVYNTLGEEIARLVDERALPAGFHTAYFESNGIPNGAYFYMLRVGDTVRTGRLVHLH